MWQLVCRKLRCQRELVRSFFLCDYGAPAKGEWGRSCENLDFM